MDYMRFFVPFAVLFSFLLIDPSLIADAKAPRKVAYLAASQSAVTPKEWFGRFDTIQRQSRIPAKERSAGAILMMRTLAGVGDVKECEEANVILKAIAARYNKAAEQLERLPELPATSSLRDGYAQWYRGNARLSEDCVALRTVNAAQHQYRRPVPEEIELIRRRKQMLDQLLTTCRYAELYIRMKEGCPLPADELFGE